MDSLYPRPKGMIEVPEELLDLRSDSEIDQLILHPPPVSHEKNIWFYWDQGYMEMHPYTQRNIRAYHRRLSKSGWVIRVVDCVKGSSSNVESYLDTKDLQTFPQAYIDGTLTGAYAKQHCSDLVRFPLLLLYGGVYTDVGFMQIGDLDRLWNETVANPESLYDVISYNGGAEDEYMLMNYFLATSKNNPLFARFHRLLLALWAADGGQVETTGMHKSALLTGVPMMSAGRGFEADGRRYSIEETNEILTDYIIQGQAMTMVMTLVDPVDHWDGPQYTVDHVYAIDYMQGSQLINEITVWDGNEAFRLMSLHLPQDGEVESADQAKARDIVEQCLLKSFGFKLAHGLILTVIGDTLGSLWRKHSGSDDVPGTYAHLLRHAMIYWTQTDLPDRVVYKKLEPARTGPLTG